MKSYQIFFSNIKGGSTASGHADEADLIALRLEKLEATKVRQRVVNRLARCRDAGALKHLGFARPAISRLLDSSGERQVVAEPKARIHNAQRQILELRRVARDLETVDRGEHDRTGDYRIDVDRARIVYQFPAKPGKTARALARRAGFKVTKQRTTYERKLDTEGLAQAAWLAKQFITRRP
jgi:hypothetical protein